MNTIIGGYNLHLQSARYASQSDSHTKALCDLLLIGKNVFLNKFKSV